MRATVAPILLVSLATLAFHSAALAGPDQSPPLPDAVVDLRTPEGASLVRARWRYTDAHIVGADHRAPGPDRKPTGDPIRTHDIHPRLGTPDFDQAPWQPVDPSALETRRSGGLLSFGWYRLDFVLPDTINGLPTAGTTVVLEITTDDYAEVWTGGSLPTILGQSGGQLISGWNTPNRVTLTTDARPGEPVHAAIFAANGPLSAPPPNYIWIRSATLDIYKPGRGQANAPTTVPTTITRLSPSLDAIIAPGTRAQKLADGFSFIEGPVWIPPVSDSRYGGGGPGNYLLFSDPNKNVIHRFDPLTGQVSIFRTKSGYSGIGGANIGEYHQPGSNGLALDPQGRLTICEHGNRRITRLEPGGSITVLADGYQGKRLNSPNDLVYRSDGALFFTDPPFGLPKVFDDPRKELPYSGVFCLYNGTLKLATTDLSAPNGLAFSPDEKYLYVDNWDVQNKVIRRYEVAPDGSLSGGTVFFDMTSTPGEICLDGLKVDARGNLFVSGPGGIWIISAAAEHLGTLVLPELPANFAFGGPDNRTLYMAARTGLYQIRVNQPGIAR